MAAKKDYPKRDKNEAVEALLKRIEDGTKAVYESDCYAEMLKCMAKFHHYSANNMLLIYAQRPSATHVAGYKSWETKFNRHVKKGEKGIEILGFTPKTIWVEREKKDELGFVVRDANGEPEMEKVKIKVPAYKPMHVWDVDQTEGEPLPTIYNGALEGGVKKFDVIQQALIELSPVPITIKAFEGNAMGYYNTVEKSITVKEGLSELQTVKTMIHEIGHAQMHALKPGEEGYIPIDRPTMELEAESVAFVCCAYLGLDTDDYSFPYIAGWAADKDMTALHDSLDRIRTQAVANIEFLEQKLEQALGVEQEQSHDTYTIYQITDQAADIRFADMEWLNKVHKSVDPANYEQIYSAPLEPNDDLETLFTRFNMGPKPEGYKGHSMSVSDIVVLNKDGVETAYFCDSIGFTEVPEFLNPPQKEQKPMSLAQRLAAARSAVENRVAQQAPKPEQSVVR